MTVSTRAPANVVVRELAEYDLRAYKRLRDEALTHHEDAFTSDAATEALRTAESYRARLGDGGDTDGAFTLGAFDGDVLVGAISCERDARGKARHLGHLVGMMVDRRRHGEGIGRALLDATLARARADDTLQQLTLSVTATNAAAIRVYERAGFTRYGTLPHAVRVAGRYLDKHLMRLPLR